MRIMAIRGNNLASLSGSFELELEAPPLLNAGLFVITGHTGAGKSTLLDALCLALFDRMPRLPEGHGIAVGRAEDDEALRVKSNDVSSILRRGCGSGYAEVDFRGADGKHYRSRWEVRRARGKAEGRLQPQTLALTELETGQLIGDGKRDTLMMISERLGLTFDQFRRSVLLAQGDFAAFLKANANERSSLLERITGTALYSDISKAAYERSTREALALSELEQRLQGVVPLDGEARALLVCDKERLDSVQVELTAEGERLKRQLGWYEAATVLAEERKLGEKLQLQAELAWEQSQPRRQLLQRIELAQPLRGILDACRRGQHEVTEAADQLQQAENDLISRQTARKQAEDKHKDCSDRLATAEEEQKQAQPDLKRSRELDARIGIQVTHVERKQLEQQRAKGRQNESFQTLERLRQLLEGQRQEQRQTTEWLTTHGDFEPVTPEWGRWQAELHRFVETLQSQKGVDQICSELRQEIGRNEQSMESQKGKHRQAVDGLRLLNSEIDLLEQQGGGDSLEQLRSERNLLEQQQGGIRRGLELLQQLAAVTQQRLDDQSEEKSVRSAIETHRREEGEAAERLIGLNRLLEEVKAARDVASLAQGEHAESLRGLLQEGEHCPVCGSKEHPWASLEKVFDQQLDSLNKRLAELEGEKESWIDAQSTHRNGVSQGESMVESLSQRCNDHHNREQQLKAEWQILSFTDKPEEDHSLVELCGRVERLSLDNEARLTTIRSREERAIVHQKLKEEKRQERERLQDSEREIARRKLELEGMSQRLREQSERHQEKRAELARQQQAIIDLLAVPLGQIPQWQQQLSDNPSLFIEQCRSGVETWRHQSSKGDELNKQLEQTESKVASAGATLNRDEIELQGCEANLKDEREALGRLKRERDLLLGGRGADEVEAQLEKSVADARQERELAQGAFNTLAAELVGLEERAGHWQKALADRKQLYDAEEKQLGEALEGQLFDREELEKLLSRESDWVVEERGFIATLKEGLDRSQTVLKERVQRCESHQQGEPEASRESLSSDIEVLNLKLEETRRSLVAVMTDLRLDDEKRETSGLLESQLQSRRGQWELWAGLNELIGSHDGKKFRTFAQSLTLDSLLGYANEHLKDLARRYRLQRVPGSDLELQVIDTDMGDEVRSVHSLSGGESFLVSLALALGLASLSSSTTQVESLFIDEGFGSLDQETLDIAIASLDTLQSLGRKVGVISHVTALVERIGVRVMVEKRGGGRSRVTVAG